MNHLTCDKKCCNYFVTKYNHPSWYKSNDDWKDPTEKMKIKKAGAFIFDKNKNKILLVQSRGQYWGPPKGSLNENEDIKHCAKREIKEETGLDIEENEFNRFYIVKGKALYYYVELEEKEIEVQTHIKDNDANGVGWFNIDCLENLIKEKEVLVNLHCKILLKKYLNKNLIYKKI